MSPFDETDDWDWNNSNTMHLEYKIAMLDFLDSPSIYNCWELSHFPWT